MHSCPCLEQLQHAQVLLGRQRDIQVVDSLAHGDLARLVERPEQRQPAVTEQIAPGAVVDESDDVVAELAVFENLVGHQSPEFPRAGDQDALQPDARSPAALQQLAYDLSRREREHHVDYEE